MRTKITVLSLFVTLFIVAGFLASCGKEAPAPNAPQGTTSSPAENGQVIMNNSCSPCHNVDEFKNTKKTRDQWNKTLNDMIAKGAQVSTSEKPGLLDYLSKTYK
jgi:hypothetical protein